jgi:hypothetical protein
MDIPAYYKSLTVELESLKDRVRNFIADKHWLTDGEWKESVLRSIISERLPATVKIGHGFIITEQGPTTQCDILLYRADCPVLFKEGDLVFITPDAVLAVIEVKSKATVPILNSAVSKLAAIGVSLGSHRKSCCLGLFAYENKVRDHHKILDILEQKCRYHSQIVNLLNLGCSIFTRYWEYSPYGDNAHYEHWHSYNLINMSAGYFITNIIDAVSPNSINKFSSLWFPDKHQNKEFQVEGKRAHATAILR